ncbi:MAG: hypothetical protein WC516_07970 [Patescibacteria group bacterium]|jgi:hypothetical protein
MRKITDKNDNLLAITGNRKEFKNGWTFSPYQDKPFLWGFGHFDHGYHAQPHIHRIQKRFSEYKTIEFFYVIQGAISINLFDNSKELIEIFTLTDGEFVCFYDGGHGMDIIQDNTQVIETKNGPYVSDIIEKERF